MVLETCDCGYLKVESITESLLHLHDFPAHENMIAPARRHGEQRRESGQEERIILG